MLLLKLLWVVGQALARSGRVCCFKPTHYTLTLCSTPIVYMALCILALHFGTRHRARWLLRFPPGLPARSSRGTLLLSLPVRKTPTTVPPPLGLLTAPHVVERRSMDDGASWTHQNSWWIDHRDSRARSDSSASSRHSYSSSSTLDSTSGVTYFDDGEWPDPHMRREQRLLDSTGGGNLSDVKRLVRKHGVSVNIKFAEDLTPLIVAVRDGHIDIAAYLIRHGADVNAVNNRGLTPLMLAAERKRVDIVRLLLGSTDILVNKATVEGWSALARAASKGPIEVLRVLLDAGADPNLKLKPEAAPLLRAAMGGHRDAVRFLMGEGANLNGARDAARRVLLGASVSGRADVVRCLIAIGVDLNATGKGGQTALVRATDSDKIEVVQTLLDHGADMNVSDDRGQTAISIATNRGYKHTKRLLLQYLPAQRGVVDSGRASAIVPSNALKLTWAIAPFDVELCGAEGREIGGDYKAKWLDADVVVKLFVPDASSKTFTEEVNLWHRLRHPNVVKLYGACAVGHHHFFVCEYASNGSLMEFLAICDAVSRTPWKYLHQAALGLEYLHQRQIVHGNLYGSNILIGSDGLAKLADFGVSIASRFGTAQNSGACLGPVRWQAPERLKGEQPLFASDVYSLGMCILEAVTGEAPWQLQRSEDTVVKDVSESGILLLVRRSGFIDEGWELMRQMCQKKPADRLRISPVVEKLDLLVAKETADGQLAQPKPEPLVDVAAFQREHTWNKLSGMIGAVENTLLRQLFDELQATYTKLESGRFSWRVLHEFQELVDELHAEVVLRSRESQVQRLASARVAITTADRFHGRVGVLWSTLGVRLRELRSKETRWKEQRTKHLEALVSEIGDAPSVLQSILPEEDCAACLGTLSDEVNVHASDYTDGQLTRLRKAYEEVAELPQMKLLSSALPLWFVSRMELQTSAYDRTIGTGGFGSVRTAKWLDSEVVVKELKIVEEKQSPAELWSVLTSAESAVPGTVDASLGTDDLDKRAEVLKTFRREADIWFSLSHPHVVRLFGACHLGTPFFVCEHARKGALNKYLQEHPEQLWGKLREAALGVQYLHEQEVVHGDLKCNNIVVGSDGKAKVTDFGLSSALSSAERAQLTGASQWLAPECLSGDLTHATKESDVYSLGICVVEALRIVEASVPTKDAQASEALKNHRYLSPYPWGNLPDAAVRAHAQKGELPRRPYACTDEQWSLVEKMCAFDPSERYQIVTVVEEIEKIAHSARSRAQVEAAVPPRLGLVADMTRLIDDAVGAGCDEHQSVLCRIYSLLWERIARVVPSKADVQSKLCSDAEFLDIIDRARADTRQVCESGDSLLRFTELSLSGYALHRRLDKLAVSKRLHPETDALMGSKWRQYCSSLFGGVEPVGK